MMTSYDLTKRPGLWRAGPIYVRNDETDETDYEGPDVELVRELDASDGTPGLVRAGMAHLNLVMIHPIRDGNGRMARCLQTLVLGREGVLGPEFCSIEEYRGRNTGPTTRSSPRSEGVAGSRNETLDRGPASS